MKEITRRLYIDLFWNDVIGDVTGGFIFGGGVVIAQQKV